MQQNTVGVTEDRRNNKILNTHNNKDKEREKT